jgi:hypothetical protein
MWICYSHEGLAALESDFGAACDRLRPPVALIVTELWPDVVDHIANHEQRVTEMDLERLLALRLGVVYIDSPAPEYTDPTGFDRDLRLTEHGVLIFAGQGGARWE